MIKDSLIFVIVSASLFGISPPLAKVLLKDSSPVVLAGLLYLGAFVGLTIYSGVKIKKSGSVEVAPLEKSDLLWLAGAVLTGGVMGPISLMVGLTFVSGFSASLLLNLEGVATAMIAVFFFKENAGKRLWLALTCMTLAGIFLTWDTSQGKFNPIGPLMVILAMVCWGIDNNLTRKISDKDPIQIARIKGFFGGTTSLSIALIIGTKIPLNFTLVFALILGSLSYGASLVLFIRALGGLGSFRTGAFFSFAPFIGAITSLTILGEWIGWVMFPAIGFMLVGIFLILTEKHSHLHLHEPMKHAHSHAHRELHHAHEHLVKINAPHSHEHTHSELAHAHAHWPDIHHRHEHDNGD